ncbi:hypothetical protein [Metabacillus fastidiosus]|uniref:hypothetical protein n=1 Tax=Metabacillus fastidiosus TaxID=1458 RepID=UPI003D2E4608
MTIPAITAATKSKISTVNAPAPPHNSDLLVGKVAMMKSGVYKEIEGIIYPKREGLKYIGEYGAEFEGDIYSTQKQYLLMFFYDDGTLFCAVPADFKELAIPGSPTPIPPGSGTISSPYSCGHEVASGGGSQTLIHQLPWVKGTVHISYDMFGITDRLQVFFIDDQDTPIASTNGYVSGKGSISFYFDPLYNSDRIVVKLNDGYANSGTIWKYNVSCPS